MLLALFVLAFVCGFAAAEGIGLEAGAEVGFNEVNEESNFISITPYVAYENSFGDIDVFAELDYEIDLQDEVGQTLYLEEELGYNLGLGAASTLSFIVNNQNNIFVAPDAGSGFNKFDGVVEPSVKFNQAFGFGDLYAQLGFPIGYISQVKDADISVDSYVLLGFGHGSGFGVELTLNYALSPEGGYGDTELLLFYENDTIYGEVDIVAHEKFDGGYTITPEFDYKFNAFTFWVNAEFAGIASDTDVVISPAIGVSYSF
jgi:hypothetical protein